MLVFALGLLLGLLPVRVCAAEESAVGMDAFLEELGDLVGGRLGIDVRDARAVSEMVGFRALCGSVARAAVGDGTEVLCFFCFLFGLCILRALGSVLASHPALGEVVGFGTNCICAVALFDVLFDTVQGVMGMLSETSELLCAISPLMSAVTLAGGGTSGAAAQSAVAGLTVWGVEAVCGSLMLPCVGVLFSLGLAAAPGTGARGVFDAVRRFFLRSLGVLTACVGAAVSLQSVICSAADSAAMRAAKFAAADMIPLVGSTISGALAVLSGGLAYVKSTVGVCVVAAMLLSVLPVLLRLLLHRAAMGVCVCFLEFCAPDAVGCFGALRGAFDALIAVCALFGLLFLLQIILFIKSGVAIAA